MMILMMMIVVILMMMMMMMIPHVVPITPYSIIMFIVHTCFYGFPLPPSRPHTLNPFSSPLLYPQTAIKGVRRSGGVCGDRYQCWWSEIIEIGFTTDVKRR